MSKVLGPIEVIAVAASETFKLRRDVLGPRASEPRLEDMARPDDKDPESAHFAVFDDAKHIVGSGTVRRRAAPWAPEQKGFQIRGMAVLPEYRGQGIGSALLGAIIRHAERYEADLLWCQSRVNAKTLYERAGFRIHGQPFLDKNSGQQIEMYLPLANG